MSLPHSDHVSIALAVSLSERCHTIPSNDDLEEGLAIVGKHIRIRDLGFEESPYKEYALTLATQFALTRFPAYGKPEHLEQAIYRFRTLLDENIHEDSQGAAIVALLSFLQGLRQNVSTVALNSQHVRSSSSESDKLPFFCDLAASLSELDPAKPFSHVTSMKHLIPLQSVNIERLVDVADIEDGIKYCRELLASYPSIRLTHTARNALCHFFHRAVVCASDVKYPDKAITAGRDDVKFNASYPLLRRILSLSTLISFLSTHLELPHHKGDSKELMELFPMVDEYEHAGFIDGLPSSFAWALVAHTLDHPSTSTAYDRVMSSMQAYVTFSPTLDIQHSRIVSRYNILETLPLDYASYQIHTSRLEQAIETLERGRALMWSEMRGLRTSVDRLHLANPNLAGKIAAVNRNL